MAPHHRLDRLVWIRERREDAALVQLAGAERRLAAARADLRGRAAAAAADGRQSGDATLWALDEAAHRRAVQDVRSGEREVAAAAEACAVAQRSLAQAHQQTEVAARIAARKRGELRADAERRERRDADEVAAQRHARR